jgi:hypothetical protein
MKLSYFDAKKKRYKATSTGHKKWGQLSRVG